jgi:hypothetical protein
MERKPRRSQRRGFFVRQAAGNLRTLQEPSLTISVADCPTIGCLTGNDLTYRTTSSCSTVLVRPRLRTISLPLRTSSNTFWHA